MYYEAYNTGRMTLSEPVRLKRWGEYVPFATFKHGTRELEKLYRKFPSNELICTHIYDGIYYIIAVSLSRVRCLN